MPSTSFGAGCSNGPDAWKSVLRGHRVGRAGATEMAPPIETVPSQWQPAVPVGTNDCCPGRLLSGASVGAEPRDRHRLPTELPTPPSASRPGLPAPRSSTRLRQRAPGNDETGREMALW